MKITKFSKTKSNESQQNMQAIKETPQKNNQQRIQESPYFKIHKTVLKIIQKINKSKPTKIQIKHTTKPLKFSNFTKIQSPFTKSPLKEQDTKKSQKNKKYIFETKKIFFPYKTPQNSPG